MSETTTDEFNDENGKKNSPFGVPIVFIEEYEKFILKDEMKREERIPHKKDHDFDQEDDGIVVGAPTPAEIKLKIKKSLLEFRCKVEDAILGNYLLGEPSVVAREKLRDITLWGVPLLPSKANEGTDIVLRKFLKAKDYRVNDAFDMLQRTMIWRSENNIDGILDEDLGSEFENAGFLDSRDREGRPVCYHVYGVFRDRHMYKKTFGTQETCHRFLRWRIQLMEMAVQKLCFRAGVDSMIHIYDLNHTPIQGMKELNSLGKKALILFQNYYPELIYKNVSIYKSIT